VEILFEYQKTEEYKLLHRHHAELMLAQIILHNSQMLADVPT